MTEGNEDEAEIHEQERPGGKSCSGDSPKTRKQYSAEEKIRIVVSGRRGEDSIAELCRREGIAESLYYSWSKEFLEAGKKRLSGNTARQASSGEVKDLRREMHDFKEALAEQVLENRLLKPGFSRWLLPIADNGNTMGIRPRNRP